MTQHDSWKVNIPPFIQIQEPKYQKQKFKIKNPPRICDTKKVLHKSSSSCVMKHAQTDDDVVLCVMWCCVVLWRNVLNLYLKQSKEYNDAEDQPLGCPSDPDAWCSGSREPNIAW